ncbi:unnamed protein product [Rodentolepis nana]|uniref:DUF5745 domain-containing protein n=1 Tax=Rodentolepis nana TaxID=102285 RepID=A0A0R3TLA3_RODNA|nr:unnamed protein product [Rodentolepis nana]
MNETRLASAARNLNMRRDYTMIADEELDADYFINFYTEMFGAKIVPHPMAVSADERLDNIVAIEKDIENRLNVTISHIPPHEIIDGNPSAVRDLNELMRAIDDARLSHLSLNHPREIPRRVQLTYSGPVINNSTPQGYIKQDIVSPPFTPFHNKSVEIMKSSAVKSVTDSGVVTAPPIQKVSDLNDSQRSMGTLSLLSNQIWEAKTKASLVYDLAQKNLANSLQPDLKNLRQCLISAGTQIRSAVAAVDRITVRDDEHLDSDVTTAQSLFSDYDECGQLDHELENTLREMKKATTECLVHCVKEFKKSMMTLTNRKTI